MKFSQKTEYALRALVELGRRPSGAQVSAKQIALSQGIPPRFCEQVLGELKRGGLLGSQRGSAGGTWLAKEPSAISVAEVVDLIEGTVVCQGCLDPFADESHASQHSAIQELWLDLQITLRDRLSKTSVADLVQRQADLDRSSHLVFQI